MERRAKSYQMANKGARRKTRTHENRSVTIGTFFYTEQIDAEGLGRELLLTTPGKTPEKQSVGTVTTSHKMLTLQALSSSLNTSAMQREAAWGEEIG